MHFGGKPPSIAEPVTELKRVPISENGEPLVNFLDACPLLLLDQPRFRYRRELFLRASVARMLCEASESVAKLGYRFAILEGWRPPFIQRRMYAAVEERWRTDHPDWSETKIRRITNQFTAPMNSRVPPPHPTGGAVDLHLARPDGRLLDHIRPYEVGDRRSFFTLTAGLGEKAMKTREIMAEALLPTGLTNYPSEYWHWSYGDQGWAYRGGHPAAIYGPIEPPGWSPAPEDKVDGPLVWHERGDEGDLA